MYRHTIAWPMLERFPDGKEKVYLDSGLPPNNGFVESEVQYVDPPEQDLKILLGLVAPEDAPAADGDIAPQGGDATHPDGAAKTQGDGAADGTEETPKEIEVPFHRKEPPKRGPRDFQLSCKVWSPFFAKWIKQDAVVYCLDVKETCQASGQWTEDIHVPEHFGVLELWDENSLPEMRARHKNIVERVQEHAESIKDKIVNYYRWEGQGLALVADQHGFSKQLVDFYSRAPVWDCQEEEAHAKWQAIMKDAVVVSEQALVQGVGIGPPKADGEETSKTSALKAKPPADSPKGEAGARSPAPEEASTDPAAAGQEPAQAQGANTEGRRDAGGGAAEADASVTREGGSAAVVDASNAVPGAAA